jgi:hypothetical protein
LRSRNRSRKKSPSSKPSSSSLSFALSHSDVREAVEPILGDVLTAAGRVGEQDDPLEAERFATGLRAVMCRAWRLVMDDGERIVGSALVRAAEEAGGEGALALLRAVEATWPEPASSRARSGARRLERRGVAAPRWAAALREITLEGVSMAADAHGDVAMPVATFSYGGQRRHAIAALIDYNRRGMVTKASITDEGRSVRLPGGLVPEFAGIDFRPVDPARAAAVIAAGLEAWRAADSDIAELRDGDVDQRAVLSLLEARLRWFPRAAKDVIARPPSPRACGRLVVEFLDSAIGDEDLGVEGEHVEFVARQLVDFKIRYADGDPQRWSPTVVGAFMGEWFPRKATADPEAIEILPEVVRRWVRWAGRRRGVAAALVDETLAAVGESERAFREACRDRSRFMPAKAVATAMREDQVDITDPDAVDAWFQAFRRRSPKRRREKLGQDLDVARVFVDGDRIVVATARPVSEHAKDRHLLGV